MVAKKLRFASLVFINGAVGARRARQVLFADEKVETDLKKGTEAAEEEEKQAAERSVLILPARQMGLAIMALISTCILQTELDNSAPGTTAYRLYTPC